MPKRNIQPLADRILIRRTKAETETPGGIVIPETAQETSKSGTVLAVGCGRLMDDGKLGHMLPKVGDEVIFGTYAGTEIEVDGEMLVILEQASVLAVVGPAVVES